MAPYSIVDRTNDICAVFLESFGQKRRFLLRKPSVELAFLATFEMCVVHFRSSDICKPRYGLCCTMYLALLCIEAHAPVFGPYF